MPPPLLKSWTAARAAAKVARVTMIGGSLPRAIRRPLSRPQAAPVPKAARQARSRLPCVRVATKASAMPLSPTTEPTETSMPPVAITSVMPVAITASSEDCFISRRMFSGE